MEQLTELGHHFALCTVPYDDLDIHLGRLMESRALLEQLITEFPRGEVDERSPACLGHYHAEGSTQHLAAAGPASRAYLHIDITYLPQMPDETEHRYLFVAIDRVTR